MTFAFFQLTRVTNGPGPKEKELYTEILKLKSELRAMSMQDEFAKYAKKERQILALEEQMKKQGK